MKQAPNDRRYSLNLSVHTQNGLVSSWEKLKQTLENIEEIIVQENRFNLQFFKRFKP